MDNLVSQRLLSSRVSLPGAVVARDFHQGTQSYQLFCLFVSGYSFPCFAYSQEICLSNFCLSGQFGFFFVNSSSKIKDKIRVLANTVMFPFLGWPIASFSSLCRLFCSHVS